MPTTKVTVTTYAQIKKGEIVIQYIAGKLVEIGEVTDITYLPHANSYIVILKSFGQYQWRFVGLPHDAIDIKGQTQLTDEELSAQCEAWYHSGTDFIRENGSNLTDTIEAAALHQVEDFQWNIGLSTNQIQAMVQAFIRGAKEELNYRD